MGSELLKERADYASMKRRLARYIEDTIREEGEVKFVFLHFQALRQFGIGDRVVNDYIRMMERMGLVKVDWDLEIVRAA